MTHDPHPRLRHGVSLLQDGRTDDAVAIFRQVLAEVPELADGWYNLGYALRHRGDFEGALEAYTKALRHGAALPEQIHLNRAAILSDHLQRHAQAEQALQEALALRPGYPPALLNLGNLHEECGRREQAISAYRALLAGEAAATPLAIDARTRLLQLDPPSQLDDPAILVLQRLLGTPQAQGERRASALFALAAVHDRLGDVDAAFAHADEANRVTHAGAQAYAPERIDALFARIMGAFPGTPMGTPAPPPAHSAIPLFVCGMFRSGSSLVEQVLAQHPGVRAGGELEMLPRLVARHVTPFPERAASLTGMELQQLTQAYLDHVHAVHDDVASARHLIDKRPDNFMLIGLIKRMFPSAKIVHTCRHPMDNGLSVYMHHLNPRRFGYAGALRDIGHYYGAYRRLMAHWSALYPDSIHHFDYDAFVAEPEPQLRALLDFLELPWDPACLQFHLASRPVRTASYWQVRQPLHRGASGRWRPYRTPLAPLAQALADAGIDID